LAVCVGTAAMMVRGVFVSDEWDRLSLDRERRVARIPQVFGFDPGVVAYSVQRHSFDAHALESRYSGQERVYGIWDGRWRYAPKKRKYNWRAALFGFAAARRSLTSRQGEVVVATSISVPLW